MKRIQLIFALLLFTIFVSPTFAQTAGRGASRTFDQSLAVQLWSFREDFNRDVRGTLKRVRDLGFTKVELAGYYGMTAQEFRSALDQAGLQAVSMHIEYETARDRIDEIIRDAKIFGVRLVGVPWIKSPFTRDDCLAAIRVFNQAGKRLAAHGIQFFYHLHGYEFVPDESGTGTLFDLLMKRTNPRLVSFQLDTYHVAFPGQDPVKLLQKYPGRFTSLHLKDLRRETRSDQSGDYREADATPLGEGRIDWPALLKEARKQRVRWNILEDETTAVWDNVTRSLKHLEQLGLVRPR